MGFVPSGLNISVLEEFHKRKNGPILFSLENLKCPKIASNDYNLAGSAEQSRPNP